MTVSDILQDEARRQHEFPVAKEKVFLAHAGVSPLPRRVAEAISHYATQSTLGDQETLVPAFQMNATRALAARLIGATPEEIAFVGPTSLALSYIAAGLTFRKHSNIVVYLDDYPSNVYPWMALAAHGVQVRFLNVRELGRIRYIDVLGQVDEQTRLVALASCHFATGYRIDIPAIGKALHERGILFSVDGIQTLGAFPLLAEHVDFMAADAHKWLLGPCGAGILYVRREVQDYVRPPIYGWNNVKCPDFITQEKIQLLEDARRYEAGSTNLLGLVGLHAALELALELGVDNIAAELLRKRAKLVPALQAKGYEVLHANAPAESASGIVACHKPGADMAALHQKLADARCIASLRSDRKGRKLLRFSPHYYNTDAELDRVLELM